VYDGVDCGWGVAQTCMARMWVAGKTVWSPCYTRPCHIWAI